MILNDEAILKAAPLKPLCFRTIANGMTYGLGPAGYDVRIAEDVIMHYGDFVLASTVEEFCMPDDLQGIVHDKSSWARQGVAVQNTVIEPGWRGFLTLELTNHRSVPFGVYRPIRIKAGSPIAQVVFHKLIAPALNPYNGKYQDQKAGPQPAIAEG